MEKNRDLAVKILGLVEDYLSECGASVPNTERDTAIEDGEIDEEEAAILYGAAYYALEDAITEMLENACQTVSTKETVSSYGVYAVVYSQQKHFATKEEAITFFVEAAQNSEGNEQRRYMNVLVELTRNITVSFDYNGDEQYADVYDIVASKYGIDISNM